jgi:two-component system, LytTR family, response regulator
MKVIIIEDELIAAKRLSSLLLEIDGNINIQKVIGSVIDAANYLTDVKVDLIFMDIQLSDGICFEIFEQVEVNSPVVFITAYDEYMQKAFKVNSIDYLLKPIDKKELRSSIEQFKKYIVNNNVSNLGIRELLQEFSSSKQSYKRRFLVRKGKGFVSIDVQQIAYIVSENKLTYLIAQDGKRYVVDYSLDNILALLNPTEFCKINRNYIISCNSLINMQPYFNNRMILEVVPKPAEDVLVSRSYISSFRDWMNL